MNLNIADNASNTLLTILNRICSRSSGGGIHTEMMGFIDKKWTEISVTDQAEIHTSVV